MLGVFLEPSPQLTTPTYEFDAHTVYGDHASFCRDCRVVENVNR